VLGQSAAIAAALAIDRHEGCVQRVSSLEVMEKFGSITGK